MNAPWWLAQELQRSTCRTSELLRSLHVERWSCREDDEYMTCSELEDAIIEYREQLSESQPVEGDVITLYGFNRDGEEREAGAEGWPVVEVARVKVKLTVCTEHEVQFDLVSVRKI